ncbi:MAG: hypothetical protein Q9191_005553 [Dirinaria sp. TL-2023a]
MKSLELFVLSTVALQAPTVLSRLFRPDLFGGTSPPLSPSPHQALIANFPDLVMPPSADESSVPESSAGVVISDVIASDRVINIFAGFTRDIDTIAKRLDDKSKNTTVLAPLNSEITKLPRKPWEDPEDYNAFGANAYGGSEGEDRAQRNLRRFVEAHVVPVSPWNEGEKVNSAGGGQIWWETKGGQRTIQPGDIEVSRIANKVENGELWFIKGVINYGSD